MKPNSLFSAAAMAVVVSSPLALAQDNNVPVQAAPEIASATLAPAVDHVIYLARLPAPAELVQSAETQHAKIDRMDQSSDRIVVSYNYANGRTVTFAYTLLSTIASQPPVALNAAQPAPGAPVAYAPASQPQTVVYTTAPQPSTVVYTTQPRTVYYEPTYSRYYDPVWDFWAPLAIGVGLGWGWHGGGYHGGYHGGWHGGGHGWHH